MADYWHLPLTAIPAHEHWPLSDVERHPPHADSPFCLHYQALIRPDLLQPRRKG